MDNRVDDTHNPNLKTLQNAMDIRILFQYWTNFVEFLLGQVPMTMHDIMQRSILEKPSKLTK
jgi:hypothetical protein